MASSTFATRSLGTTIVLLSQNLNKNWSHKKRRYSNVSEPCAITCAGFFVFMRTNAFVSTRKFFAFASHSIKRKTLNKCAYAKSAGKNQVEKNLRFFSAAHEEHRQNWRCYPTKARPWVSKNHARERRKILSDLRWQK